MLRRSVKIQQQRVRRMRSKIKHMKQLFSVLLKERLIEREDHNVMLNYFDGTCKELFSNEICNRGKSKRGFRYSEEFAVTLQFYSSKAYNYMRTIFCLSHESTLRDWFSSTNCESGFLNNILDVMQNMLQKNDSVKDCCIMLDEMNIRQSSEWDSCRRQFVGNVNYCTGELSDICATHALVIMAVGLKCQWKTPIAYFFTAHASSNMQVTIVNHAINKLFEIGYNVCAIVADGTTSNISTALSLGIVLHPCNMGIYFYHPSLPSKKIYWIFDACHMLKLIRNLLGDLGELVSVENGVKKRIKWEFIQALNDFQQLDSLHLANRISSSYISYGRLKMKVAVAAQTLSNSVAQAIDVL